MNWKPNPQEAKYLGVISNLSHDAQLDLFANRITFSEKIRALLKALDELPGSLPTVLSQCDCVSLSGNVHSTDCKNPVGRTRQP